MKTIRLNFKQLLVAQQSRSLDCNIFYILISFFNIGTEKVSGFCFISFTDSFIIYYILGPQLSLVIFYSRKKPSNKLFRHIFYFCDSLPHCPPR